MADPADIPIVEDTKFLRPPQPFIWQEYIPHAITLLVLAAVGAAAFLLVRRRLRNGPNPKARALRALERAAAQRAERGDFWYVLRGNRILRDFFQDAFSIEAPAQTSRQFLESASRLTLLDEPEREWLATYLEQCDRIRFAGSPADPDTLNTVHETATGLVRRLYRLKKTGEAALPPAETPSPFLPGTPVPAPADDDFTHSGNRPDEIADPSTRHDHA